MTTATASRTFVHQSVDLLSDSEAREATSWGRELNRALKHGDLEILAM